jgi:hypothetical protein
MIALASEVGSIRLALRYPDDLYAPATNGTTLTEIASYTPTRKDLEESAKAARDEAMAMSQNSQPQPYQFQNYSYPPLPQASASSSPEESPITPLPVGPPPNLVEIIMGGKAELVPVP